MAQGFSTIRRRFAFALFFLTVAAVPARADADANLESRLDSSIYRPDVRDYAFPARPKVTSPRRVHCAGKRQREDCRRDERRWRR